MLAFLKEIKKHLKIMRLFTNNYIQRQLEYRSSFFVYLIVESIVLIYKLFYVGVTYNVGVTINGLRPIEILLYNGTFFLISGIYGGFFMMNFVSFRDKVKSGDLDMIIVKPVSLQFMSTLSTIEIAVLIPNVLTGIAIVCYAWKTIEIGVSIYNVFGYLFLVFCGVIIIYNLLFLPQLLSFKLVEVEALANITSSMSNFNMMPMDIYPLIIRRIGVFIFPIFIVSNFPAMIVLNKLKLSGIIWAFIVAIGLTIGVRVLWKLSVKNYSSASS